MHLIPLTLVQWQKERHWEAAERGAKVLFAAAGQLALFFDGEYLIYTRSYDEHKDQFHATRA